MIGVENRFSASIFVSVSIGIVRRYSHFELVTAGKHELPTLLRSFKTRVYFGEYSQATIIEFCECIIQATTIGTR